MTSSSRCAASARPRCAEEVVHNEAEWGCSKTSTASEGAPDAPGNAKTAPYTRELMVRRASRQPVRDTAAAFGVSKTTLYKWLRRYREDGVLEDRSSRPHTSPRQTPAGVVHRILKLRRHRLTGRSRVCTCLHGVTVAASKAWEDSGIWSPNHQYKGTNGPVGSCTWIPRNSPVSFAGHRSMVTWPARAVEQGGSSHMSLWMTTAGSPTSR